jgi:hypothetical protein
MSLGSARRPNCIVADVLLLSYALAFFLNTNSHSLITSTKKNIVLRDSPPSLFCWALFTCVRSSVPHRLYWEGRSVRFMYQYFYGYLSLVFVGLSCFRAYCIGKSIGCNQGPSAKTLTSFSAKYASVNSFSVINWFVFGRGCSLLCLHMCWPKSIIRADPRSLCLNT